MHDLANGDRSVHGSALPVGDNGVSSSKQNMPAC